MGEVGKSQIRVDAFDKATGRTKYYEDLMPQNALYVRIKHAEIAHGFVKSVDTSAAEAIAGKQGEKLDPTALGGSSGKSYSLTASSNLIELGRPGIEPFLGFIQCIKTSIPLL